VVTPRVSTPDHTSTGLRATDNAALHSVTHVLVVSSCLGLASRLLLSFLRSPCTGQNPMKQAGGSQLPCSKRACTEPSAWEALTGTWEVLRNHAANQHTL
jgi:hypothetical protein